MKLIFGKRYADEKGDFFVHPGLSPGATGGRAVVNATMNMTNGFRQAGMKVLWRIVHLSPIFSFPDAGFNKEVVRVGLLRSHYHASCISGRIFKYQSHLLSCQHRKLWK